MSASIREIEIYVFLMIRWLYFNVIELNTLCRAYIPTSMHEIPETQMIISVEFDCF